MADRSMEGGCLCGYVRYRVTGDPIVVNACHCRDCQRLTGAPFGVNFVTETSNISILSGDLAITEAATPSGGVQTMHRCPKCGTRMWSNYNMPDVIRFVGVGTLDEPWQAEPDVHFFLRSKLPWVQIPEGVPTAQNFYDVKTVWPASSIARWRSATRG